MSSGTTAVNAFSASGAGARRRDAAAAHTRPHPGANGPARQAPRSASAATRFRASGHRVRGVGDDGRNPPAGRGNVISDAPPTIAVMTPPRRRRRAAVRLNVHRRLRGPAPAGREQTTPPSTLMMIPEILPRPDDRRDRRRGGRRRSADLESPSRPGASGAATPWRSRAKRIVRVAPRPRRRGSPSA